MSNSVIRTHLFCGWPLLVLLLFILGLRAASLEVLDLIDSTESRYAAVALEMVHTGDYLTPQLPFRNEIEPYLGKPPLHFWLTALSYELFGIDEWSSRLSSFLALCVICGALIGFAAIAGISIAGWWAAIFTSTSGLMFFFAGASVMDVTFSAAITAALLSAYLLVNDGAAHPPLTQNRAVWVVLLFWLALSAGFLIKGPAVLMYVGLPLLLFLWREQNLPALSKLQPVLGIFLFIALCSPWFLLMENMHAGFLKYFFVNENLLRYAVDDYGDRYGNGHEKIYGSSWPLFLASFLPWSFALIPLFRDRAGERSLAHPLARFTMWWCIAPLLFLTFMGQYHAGYILPVIPGGALLLAWDLTRDPARYRTVSLVISVLAGLTLSVICLVGLFVGGIPWFAVCGALLGIGTSGLAYRYRERAGVTYSLLLAPFAVVVAYVGSNITLAPAIGARRSTEKILACVARNADHGKPLEVAMLEERSFSAHLFEEVWEHAAPQPMRVRFVLRSQLDNPEVTQLIILAKDATVLSKDFSKRAQMGNWIWYTKTSGALPAVSCDIQDDLI